MFVKSDDFLSICIYAKRNAPLPSVIAYKSFSRSCSSDSYFGRSSELKHVWADIKEPLAPPT